MMKEKSKSMGRPKLKDELMSNGLYRSQWDRIVKDATILDIPAASYHRSIIRWYYNEKDAAERDAKEAAEIATAETASYEEGQYTRPDLFNSLPTTKL